jgi:hypothetical protein
MRSLKCVRSLLHTGRFRTARLAITALGICARCFASAYQPLNINGQHKANMKHRRAAARRAGALAACFWGATLALLLAPRAAAAAPAPPPPASGRECFNISGWTTLARAGMPYGSGVWGAIKGTT